MKNILFFISIMTCAVCNAVDSQAQAPSLNGSWEGKLVLSPEMSLRLVLNISDCTGETPSVTMDSPDQGAYGIPTTVDFISTDSLNVSVPQINFRYKGKLENDSVKGEFSQGYVTMPMTLTKKTTSLNRPQTPVAPFPYITEEICFKSVRDDAELYGTLSRPSQETKDTPAVILVTGSGTQNRDEELFGHKPFAVIADYLARNGIASLRYDDRGFDPSTGESPNSTTAENALDAAGGIKYLKDNGFSKVGIIGHSEGGLIADKVASEGNLVDFIIELGGPAVPGDSILIYQNEFLMRDGNTPVEYVTMYIDAMKGLLDSQKDINPVRFNEEDYEIFSSQYGNNPVVTPLVKNLKENFYDLNPWLKYFINYNPIIDISKISVPVLMLYGEKDTQVPPSLNIPVLEKNAPNVKLKVYPDLNHLMQHSKTGKVTEYAEIEETFSLEVLEDIKTFILSLE